ncbi:MAG: type II secretion system GspH family protein [Heliobacteriaceae bacterium]|jgi:prepilin-type N-terminal cleavage/methylation domain-containing protein|nr:type II secretion system GspH family protein [Heliobacteriaceae bacterium]
MRKNYMSLQGFTLAEVLITLGIIGVVAALTMPSLVANYQKHVTVTRLKKAYSLIWESVKLAVADHGEISDWEGLEGYTLAGTEAVAAKYFEPYIKGLEYCNTGFDKKCGGALTGIFGRNYKMPDGTQISFNMDAYTPDLIGEVLYYSVDINGPKPPNKQGNDVFSFTALMDGRVVPGPFIENATRKELMEGIQVYYGTVACSSDKTLQYGRYMCTQLIMQDGWQIKDDYPW